MHPEHRQGGKAMAGLTLTKVPAQGKGRHRDRPRTLQVPAELKILVGTSSCCGRRRARSERVREQYVTYTTVSRSFAIRIFHSVPQNSVYTLSATLYSSFTHYLVENPVSCPSQLHCDITRDKM